jgi:hypothetical protein
MKVANTSDDDRRAIQRVQTGVRIERRILQVLKAMAEMHAISLGDLLEGIVLHAFEGKAPFGPDGIGKIRQLKDVYGLDLEAGDSHLLVESKAAASKAKTKKRGRK